MVPHLLCPVFFVRARPLSLLLCLPLPPLPCCTPSCPPLPCLAAQRLMEAVAEYQAVSGQRVFVEYVMLAGVNTGLEQAHQLGQLLQVGPASGRGGALQEQPMIHLWPHIRSSP